MAKPLLIIELDAFNDELLNQAVNEHQLPYLNEILSFKRSIYQTNDRYNSGLLEPWVQWQSIYTGLASKNHHTKLNNEYPVVKNFIDSLNTVNIQVAHFGCHFSLFTKDHKVPSLWQSNHSKNSEENECLLKLSREVSSKIHFVNKNKLKLNLFLAYRKLKKTISKEDYIQLRKTLDLQLKEHGLQDYLLIAHLEKILILKLASAVKKSDADIFLIHLNTLNYLQTHYWGNRNNSIPPIILNYLKELDQYFSKVLENIPNANILLHNGLSQMQSQHDNSLKCRIIDPVKLLIKLRTRFLNAYNNIHHRVHVECVCEAHRDETANRLMQVKVGQSLLFNVYKSEINNKILEFNVCLSKAQLNETDFVLENIKGKISNYINILGPETAKYIPLGTVYTNALTLPDHIPNHSFNRYLLNYLNPEKFDLPPRESNFSFKFDLTDVENI